MTAPTPAQAAYERHQTLMRRRFPGIAPIGWEELDDRAHADWQEIAGEANSALNTAIAKIVAERNRLKSDFAETRRALALAMTPGALECAAIIANDETCDLVEDPPPAEVAVRKADLDVLVAACTSYLPTQVSPEVGAAFARLLAAFDKANRENAPSLALPGVLPSGPFTGTEEWAVFYGGETPDDCAGFDVLSCQAEAEEDVQWRVTGGVARRSVLYGRWAVTVPPKPEENGQ